MRLECVKIAANIVVQFKDPKISVTSLAKQFMKFIDTVDGDDIDDTPVGEVSEGWRSQRRLES